MIEHRWQLRLVAWGAAALLLGALYVLQRRSHHATAVDAGRAGSVAAAAVLCAVLGPGDLSHRVLVGAIAGLENVRSRGHDYRRYRREASVFVPWFPRSSTGS